MRWLEEVPDRTGWTQRFAILTTRARRSVPGCGVGWGQLVSVGNCFGTGGKDSQYFHRSASWHLPPDPDGPTSSRSAPPPAPPPLLGLRSGNGAAADG